MPLLGELGRILEILTMDQLGCVQGLEIHLLYHGNFFIFHMHILFLQLEPQSLNPIYLCCGSLAEIPS